MITLDSPTKSLQAWLAETPIVQQPNFVAQYARISDIGKCRGMGQSDGPLDGINPIDIATGPDGMEDISHDVGYLKILNMDSENTIVHLALYDSKTNKTTVFVTMTLRPLDVLLYDNGKLYSVDGSGRQRMIQENVDIEKGQYGNYLSDLLDVEVDDAKDGSVLVHQDGRWLAGQPSASGLKTEDVKPKPRPRETPGRALQSSYLCLGIDHEQHPVLNDHIQFNSKIGRNGTEIACNEGVFSLQAGMKWRLRSVICANFFTQEGELVIQWYDVTNPNNPTPVSNSILANIRPPSGKHFVSCQPEAFTEIVTKKSILVECRFVSVANVNVIDIDSTYATVEILAEL